MPTVTEEPSLVSRLATESDSTPLKLSCAAAFTRMSSTVTEALVNVALVPASIVAEVISTVLLNVVPSAAVFLTNRSNFIPPSTMALLTVAAFS